MNNNLVFGTDPEVFAGYNKDGKVFVMPPAYFRHFLGVPASDDIKHPVFIDMLKEAGILIMEDGVAFEFGITPDSNWKNLFERVNLAKKVLADTILSKFPNDCLSEVFTLPTINYEVERWQQYQEMPEFLMSMIFGCDPDRDAFNYAKKGRVVNALLHEFRYGGGHIHISGSQKIQEEPLLAIQSLAFSAGLAAIAFSDRPDLDKARTYLYGQPGKYRIQKYRSLFNEIPFTDMGVEYRTPSNRWTNSFEHAEKLFNWIEVGVHNLLEDGLILELLPKMSKQVQETIVNCDQNTAKEMLSFIEAKI